ncbi:MAG: 4Fe-4S dicluster domain-containing protein [Nitrospira sp.]|jgi:polyferredoxin|nr:4Fe-4S dicluster domain-containing protein [Nitrospira sp.]
MSTVASPPAPQLPLITIETRKEESHGSCHVHAPLNLAPTRRHKYRMIALALVHVYIAFHLIAWHVFGIEIWGKTAMMGVPSLAKGTINAASIMVLLILGSILVFGRGFCGWVCHMRGAIEFADWILRKLKIAHYEKIRNKNLLINTPHRWLLRIGALFILLLPVIILIHNAGFSPKVSPMSPPPLADLPGFEGKAFAKTAFFNIEINPTWSDFFIAFGLAVFIQFMMSVVLNLRYGHGAFCRILCPYVTIMVPLMNRSPLQSKITRVAQCTGCRDCSNACPQGIDVSREIWHFDGKVTNLECIKCYACIDACDDNVLKDTSAPGVPQTDRLKPYEKRPWQQETVRKDGLLTNARHMQVFEPLGPVADFMSLIVALVCGGVTSRFGGFWFYPGAIFSFIVFRECCLHAEKWFSAPKEKAAPTPVQS